MHFHNFGSLFFFLSKLWDRKKGSLKSPLQVFLYSVYFFFLVNLYSVYFVRLEFAYAHALPEEKEGLLISFCVLYYNYKNTILFSLALFLLHKPLNI